MKKEKITVYNSSFEVEFKIKEALKKHNISIYRVAKLTGIRYELLRRSLALQRTLSANELILILKCTDINYEDLM